MKILLTGFEPFGAVMTNPSQLIVEHFARQAKPEFKTEVLPVVYEKADVCIRDLLNAHQPDVVLMLGVAQNRDAINLERIAINVSDAAIADNSGVHRSGQHIVDGAPAAYWSTLPLDALYDAIRESNIPVKFSNHAGAYLCNYVFYLAQHVLETTGREEIPCGFIHLPGLDKMSIEIQIRAIEQCLQVLVPNSVVKQES